MSAAAKKSKRIVARTTATDGSCSSATPPERRRRAHLSLPKRILADRIDIRIDAQDAKHISAERRAQLEESYLPHEREARIHGIPQLGIARVFPFPIESLDAPFDPDKDIRAGRMDCRHRLRLRPSVRRRALRLGARDDEFYVVDGFKMERGEAFTTSGALPACAAGCASRSPGRTTATHEKGSGIALAEVYRRLGAPMLGTHAENKGGGYHTEPAIEDMCGFMKREHIFYRQPHERTGRGDSSAITETRITRSCGSATT